MATSIPSVSCNALDDHRAARDPHDEGKGLGSRTRVALVFAVVMNSGLLLPNPYMPEAVRMAHLVETASSNFVFGCAIVWLLHRHHDSLSDLFKATSAAR